MKNVDARGLTCPDPVIRTKKALSDSPDSVIVMVDNETSKINVERFLIIAGYQVNVAQAANGDYSIIGKKQL